MQKPHLRAGLMLVSSSIAFISVLMVGKRDKNKRENRVDVQTRTLERLFTGMRSGGILAKFSYCNFLTRIVKTEELGIHGYGIVLDLHRFGRAEEGRGHPDKEDQKQARNERFHRNKCFFCSFQQKKARCKNYVLSIEPVQVFVCAEQTPSQRKKTIESLRYE